MIIKKPIKDFDLSFIDTEFTGVGLEHELIEIAVIRVNSFNFSVLDEWEAKIKPQHIELAQEEALKINGYNEKDWENAMEPKEALEKFLEKVDGSMLVGHNLSNDWFYICKALLENNLAPTFFYKNIDTFSLAWQKLRNDKNIKTLSLGELTRYFGITREKPHSALDDARTAYKVFLKLIDVNGQ